MKIGIYLGDIKRPQSLGGLTFELTFVDELLKQKTNHEFIFYYLKKRRCFITPSSPEMKTRTSKRLSHLS